MDRTELEKILVLQEKAYQLLLWLGRQARNSPIWLDVEALGSGAPCEAWLRQKRNALPTNLLPPESDLRQFALLLSAFFNTSFHVEKSGLSWKLVKGAKKFTGRRNKRHATERAIDAAAELRGLALASLAEQEQISLSDETARSLLNAEQFQDALGVWSYACELMRRSEFASQGAAVHAMWLELDEKKRTRITADIVWKARTQLVAALRAVDSKPF